MYHICFSNPAAWEISLDVGVYGNKGTDCALQSFWGRLIDLLIIKPGDKVFFFVIDKGMLFGIYEVVDDPYYCQNDLFENNNEKYPFRFNFQKYKNYENGIPISELAKAIEIGLLKSITSFERDRNATFRGIRQLTFEEGNYLEGLLLRFNPKSNSDELDLYEHDLLIDEVEAVDLADNLYDVGHHYDEPIKIEFNRIPTKRIRGGLLAAKYETILQGYIAYCIRRDLHNVIEDLNLINFSECMFEVPFLKAQQFRADLLCLYRVEPNSPHFYSVIEIKKEHFINTEDLSQLLRYMKSFAESLKTPFNSFEGIYLSIGFQDPVIDYLLNRKQVELENPIRLIRYSVTEEGIVSFDTVV